MKWKPASQSPTRGVALVITLFFLVIVSIVVVGFIETARLERSASGSHFERMRATMMAGEGVERVMATLQQNAGDAPYNSNLSSYVPRNWVSQPGALAATDLSSTNHTLLTKQVLLSSGAPSAPYQSGSGIDLVLRPPDLNTQILVDQSPPTHLLSEAIDPTTNAPVQMKVRWIYVRQDGSYDLDSTGMPTEAPVATNKTNPIVGRFAYWADDESAKVNYNLAWTRDPGLNTNPEGSQTRIDLRAMPGFTDMIANGLHSFITTTNFLPSGSNPGLNRFYNTPFDARQQGDTATRAALNTNKFNLTHYNADPDTTYYGQPRMMLTTQLSKAVIRDAAGNILTDSSGNPITRPFLDILKNPSNSLSYIDPGINGLVSNTGAGGSNGNVDATKLNAVVNNLVTNYLQRNDWPMVDTSSSGTSIQQKYYSLYPTATRQQRLAQLALNIIDYVRSAESQLNVVQPTRAKWLSNVFTPDFINSSIQGTDDTFKGLTRAPHITELGFWVSDTPEPVGSTNAGRYRSLAMIEIHLPKNYGIGSLDLLATDGQSSNSSGWQTRATGKPWTVYVNELTATYKVNPASSDPPVPLYYTAAGKSAINEYTIFAPHPVGSTASTAFVWDARLETAAQVASASSKSKMAPGDYRIIAVEVYRAKSKTDIPTVTLRSAMTVSGGPRIDVTPLATPLTYKLDLNAPDETSISSFETADPRVNGLTNDWGKQSSQMSPPPATLNTFDSQNAAYTSSLATPLTVTPKQDLDTSGKVSDASFRMPPPYDTSSPTQAAQTGNVWSAGELGLIHTGIEGSNSAPIPAGLKSAGIPWRSLHLQPSSQDTSVVPDWAFMDLFTVPSTVPTVAAALFAPHSNSAGGRVNVNAKPVPFDLQRTDPLVAVLYGARNSTATTTSTLSLAQARTIAQNIYDHTLAQSGVLPAGKFYPKTSTSGLTVYKSPGEIAEIAGVADQGEDSEELVREIGNLITARGNVFSIYSVGQALKQTPAGKLVVTGEQRQQAMIERYVISKGTSTPNDDAVGFRTVYFRNLTP